jgi:hypothetical protein
MSDNIEQMKIAFQKAMELFDELLLTNQMSPQDYLAEKQIVINEFSTFLKC